MLQVGSRFLEHRVVEPWKVPLVSLRPFQVKVQETLAGRPRDPFVKLLWVSLLLVKLHGRCPLPGGDGHQLLAGACRGIRKDVLRFETLMSSRFLIGNLIVACHLSRVEVLGKVLEVVSVSVAGSLDEDNTLLLTLCRRHDLLLLFLLPYLASLHGVVLARRDHLGKPKSVVLGTHERPSRRVNQSRRIVLLRLLRLPCML